MLTMGKIDRLMVLLISPASEKNMAILELIQGTIQLKLQQYTYAFLLLSPPTK